MLKVGRFESEDQFLADRAEMKPMCAIGVTRAIEE